MTRGSKASQKRKPSAHKTDGDGMELNSSGTGKASPREFALCGLSFFHHDLLSQAESTSVHSSSSSGRQLRSTP